MGAERSELMGKSLFAQLAGEARSLGGIEMEWEYRTVKLRAKGFWGGPVDAA